MQVAVTKRDLLRILGRCQGVADKKSTMPVLGNVLLEVEGPDKLRLAATDLYLAVSGSIHAEVDKGGAIAVGARDQTHRGRQRLSVWQVYQARAPVAQFAGVGVRRHANNTCQPGLGSRGAGP